MSGPDLKQWREQRGLTQAQLADLIGVHRVTLARWEVGMRVPHPMLDHVLATIDRQIATVDRDAPQEVS